MFVLKGCYAFVSKLVCNMDSVIVTYMLDQLKHDIAEKKCHIDSNILLWMTALIYTLTVSVNFLLHCSYSVN